MPLLTHRRRRVRTTTRLPPSTICDTLVIGACPARPASSYHLTWAGLSFRILEYVPRIGSSSTQRYESADAVEQAR